MGRDARAPCPGMLPACAARSVPALLHAQPDRNREPDFTRHGNWVRCVAGLRCRGDSCGHGAAERDGNGGDESPCGDQNGTRQPENNRDAVEQSGEH